MVSKRQQCSFTRLRVVPIFLALFHVVFSFPGSANPIISERLDIFGEYGWVFAVRMLYFCTIVFSCILIGASSRVAVLPGRTMMVRGFGSVGIVVFLFAYVGLGSVVFPTIAFAASPSPFVYCAVIVGYILPIWFLTVVSLRRQREYPLERGEVSLVFFEKGLSKIQVGVETIYVDPLFSTGEFIRALRSKHTHFDIVRHA
jgi:hypothetical protein